MWEVEPTNGMIVLRFVLENQHRTLSTFNDLMMDLSKGYSPTTKGKEYRRCMFSLLVSIIYPKFYFSFIAFVTQKCLSIGFGCQVSAIFSNPVPQVLVWVFIVIHVRDVDVSGLIKTKVLL